MFVLVAIELKRPDVYKVAEFRGMVNAHPFSFGGETIDRRSVKFAGFVGSPKSGSGAEMIHSGVYRFELGDWPDDAREFVPSDLPGLVEVD